MMSMRTIPYLFLVMILLCINCSTFAATSGDGEGEEATLPSCESIAKSYPKEETDLKGNLYTMNLSSVECECSTTNEMSSITCTYAADGTSDTGSTKYDWVDCIAIEGKVCYKIPEGECKEPTDWKEHELFYIAKFEQEVFDPWCFVSIEENAMNASTVLLIRNVVMIMVTSMIAWT